MTNKSVFCTAPIIYNHIPKQSKELPITKLKTFKYVYFSSDLSFKKKLTL